MPVTAADLALAHALADAAGAAIRPYFRAEHGIELKGDGSPVTLADRAAEAAMRRHLSEILRSLPRVAQQHADLFDETGR